MRGGSCTLNEIHLDGSVNAVELDWHAVLHILIVVLLLIIKASINLFDFEQVEGCWFVIQLELPI